MSFLQTNTSEKASVQVAVRIRPINSRELSSDVITDVQNNSVHIKNPTDRKKKNFNFDYAFDYDTPQETIFEHIGEKVISNAYSGYNCCVFAYGQTGTGKSFAMMGSPTEPGLIPRICQALYERQSNSNGMAVGSAVISYKLELSYMEIYSEEVRDLLVKQNPVGGLKVRQHPELGPYVEGLSQVLVEDFSTIKKLIDSGNKERVTASTAMNDKSSRSHAIAILYFTQLIDEPSIGKTREVVSKINLVDLAGSERVEMSQVTGINFKEAININKSLSTLGLVISKLAAQSNKNVESAKVDKNVESAKVDKKPVLQKVQSNPPYDRYSPTTTKIKPKIGHSPSQISNRSPSNHSPASSKPSPKTNKKSVEPTITEHVPFRDSVLTWILKDSLGGNSKTYMLATVSPSALNYNESLSTLRYAHNAKQIVNTVKINEDPSDKLIRVLKSEIEALRMQLATKGSDSTTPAAELKQLKEELAMREELMREKDKSWEQKLSESKRISQETQDLLKKEFLAKQDEYEKKVAAMEAAIASEREKHIQEVNFMKTNLSDKSSLEEELAKKQAEFEKGRIVDTAVSLQEYYEKKMDALRIECNRAIDDARMQYSAKADALRDLSDSKISDIRAEYESKRSDIRAEYEAKSAAFSAKIDEIRKECAVTVESIKLACDAKLAGMSASGDARTLEELKTTKLLNAKLAADLTKAQTATLQQAKQFVHERTILSRRVQQLQAKVHSLEGSAPSTGSALSTSGIVPMNDVMSPMIHVATNTEPDTIAEQRAVEFQELTKKIELLQTALEVQVSIAKEKLKNPTIEDLLNIKNGFIHLLDL
jgi:hypothetical protein